MARTARKFAIVRTAFLSLAFVGFVLAALFAVSPSLHGWAHQGSGDADHQCLATLLHAGACDDAMPAPPAVPGVENLIEAAPECRSRFALSLFLSCRILEHAPPAVS